MTPLQQSTALGAFLWLAMHVVHAITYVEFHPYPLAWSVALACFLAANALAIRPLFTGESGLTERTAALCTGLGVASLLLVTGLLGADGQTTYANWPTGGLAVLIAALVIVRENRWAVLLSVTVCATNFARLVANDTLSFGVATGLFSTTVLWFTAAAVARRFLDRTEQGIAAFRQDTADSIGTTDALQAVSSAGEVRRRELATMAEPLLQELASGETVTPSQAHRCASLAVLLRDELRARYLISAPVRDCLTQARAAGANVTVLDDRLQPADDATAHLGRRIIVASLPQLANAHVVYRVAPDGSEVTCVAFGGPDGTLEAAARALTLIGGDPTVVNDSLVMRFTTG